MQYSVKSIPARPRSRPTLVNPSSVRGVSQLLSASGNHQYYHDVSALLRNPSTLATRSLGLIGFMMYSVTSNGKGWPNASEKLVNASTGILAREGSFRN